MKNKITLHNFLVLSCMTIVLLVSVGLTAVQGQLGCPNLVINGDFQAGNSGFTSGLPQNCDPEACQVASYCVGNEFQSKCNLWPDDFWDHTFMNSSGSFMSIDGNTNTPTDVWTTTVNVSTGVAYEFGFWAASVYPASSQQFDLGLVINNNPSPPTVLISQTPPMWTYYSTVWVSNITGAIPISIRQMTAGAFRDFGLDDIRFSCVSCHADFIPEVLGPCGSVQFINQSVGQLPATFFWDFDDPNSGAGNTSILDHPFHQFSTCGTFNVCLTIVAANGCIETICKPVTITDNIPPVALCQPGQGYDLLANCTLPLTVAMIDGGSFDNCQIQSMVVNPAVIQGCGVFSVSLTVTDWCGNVSVCNTEVQTIESESPFIVCPQDVTVTAPFPDCHIPVQGIQSLGANDNCGLPIVTYTTLPATTGGISSSDASGSVFGQGSTTVTYTATDDCGNMALCSFQVIVLCDSCCADIDAFCLALENAVTFTLNEDSCKATLNIGDLPCDDYLEWIDWGDGQQDFGPHYPGDMPMHVYTGGGTFTVSYLAIRLDPVTGFICLEKVLTDTITLVCNPCNSCPNNLVQNSGFFEGAVPGELGGAGSTNNWFSVAGTPDLSVNIPHCDPFGVQMFGSLDAGEAIAQTGFNFAPGNTYTVSFSAHFFNHAGALVPFVQFEFLASNTSANPYPNCAGCETMGISPQITSTTYQTYTLPGWSPSQGFNTLIIKTLNASNQPLISFGRIDNICIDVLVGLNETSLRLPLKIFPNPAFDKFTLELPEPATPGTSLRIIGLTGQLMMERPIKPGTLRQELDAGDLPSGLYFLQVWSKERIMGTEKFVKQ